MSDKHRKHENYNLEFQTREHKKFESFKRWLLGFLAIVLLLVVVSVIMLQRDGLFIDQIIGGYFSTTEPSTEEPEGVWKYSGSAAFLLSETDDNGKSLRFLALLRADIARQHIDIFALSPQAKAPMDGGITLEQALRNGGQKQLKAAVEALTESRVDRYISSRDMGFVKAMNTVGSVTVQVEKRIQYRSSEFSITLAEGQQRLQGDLTLRYFRYLGTLGEEGLRKQSELLRSILESCLIPKNAENPETMQKRFDTLINLMETDISVLDFAGNLELLRAVMSSEAFAIEAGE
ncbi:MAG: LCP family protein [Oscillospiraceae bacterium]|nr:LCP family protein [Oscillospiraceae bacterium]